MDGMYGRRDVNGKANAGDSQLKLVKNLKTSIIEMSQREMQLFNAFKEASAKNPSLTYDEFIKTMK